MAGSKRQLAAYVHVENPDTHLTEAFGPGDDVPAWARKAITNPAAWREEEAEAAEPDQGNSGGTAPPDASEADRKAAEEAAAAAAAASAGGGSGGGDGAPDPGNSGAASEQPPPMGGPGSGVDAWRAFAERRGVTVSADASRDDVLAALKAADVATERQ